ncbi:ATP-binding protein [Streptomyces sp. NPDC005648]|uniref:ATP-binding protein n=1 Tax=Streptomyces sp. NPDC005648 TaxID=3157044 RepID=UPI0033A995FE
MSAHPATLSDSAATLRLSGTRQGCAQAREFTERTLSRWRLDQQRDDALSIVSELVSNALVHARPHDADQGSDAEVLLKLTLRGPHLLCAVTDSGSTLPICPQTPAPLSEHGRGLRIVDALAEHWGWTRHALKGKTVWAMLPTGRGGWCEGAATA